MTWRQSLALLFILLLGGVFRLSSLDWDGYKHYHPDERYIAWVATTIEWPDSWQEGLHPHRSPLNPFYWTPDAASDGIRVPQDEARHFAYGHVPLYLGVGATRLAERLAPLAGYLPAGWFLTQDILNAAGRMEYDHLTVVARAFTALLGVATVAITFALGRRLYDARVGLLAAALLAVAVLPIQLAHFFAVDPYLTFFTTVALWALAAAAQRPGAWPVLILAAIAIGLAVGAKFSAVLLFLPLALLLWLDGTLNDRQAAGRLLLLGGLAFLVFALTNPFALLDWSCTVLTPGRQLGPVAIPSLNLGNCYLDNVMRQSAMVRGSGLFPFTRQYVGTTSFVYPLLMQVRWGLGPLLGVLAVAAFAWLSARLLVRLAARLPWPAGSRAKDTAAGCGSVEVAWRWFPPATRAELVVLAWAIPYFVTTGSFFVKFMRYMEPLLPLWAIFGAALLLHLARRWRRAALLLAGVTLAGTTLYAVAFMGLYNQEHPWLLASRWLHRNAASGAVIAGEKWDETLPSSLEVDGVYRSRALYRGVEIDWLGGVGARDDAAKLRGNLSLLAGSDYLVVASNRVYGVAGRLPQLYPQTSHYYRLLFDGDLGYEPVFIAARAPHLGNFWLWPDRFERANLSPPSLAADFLANQPMVRPGYADESFTVYDQPFVMLFRNTGRLSVDQMLAFFEIDGIQSDPSRFHPENDD